MHLSPTAASPTGFAGGEYSAMVVSQVSARVPAWRSYCMQASKLREYSGPVVSPNPHRRGLVTRGSHQSAAWANKNGMGGSANTRNIPPLWSHTAPCARLARGDDQNAIRTTHNAELREHPDVGLPNFRTRIA